MGDSFSRIADDIEEYESRCEKYGEKMQYAGTRPDCYGEHARILQEREEAERREVKSTYHVVFYQGNKQKLSVAQIQDNMRYELSEYKRASRQEFTTREAAVSYAKHLARVHNITFLGEDEEDDFLD